MKRIIATCAVVGACGTAMLLLVCDNEERLPEETYTSKIAPVGKNSDPKTVKQRTAETPPYDRLEAIDALYTVAVATPGVQETMQDWQDTERKNSKFIKRRLANGRQVVVVLAPVTAVAKNAIKEKLRSALEVGLADAAKHEIEQVESRLHEWFAFHDHERVLEINYVVSINQSQEFLDGAWFDVENAQAIRDHVHFMDYGTIVDNGALNNKTLRERYGALFSIEEQSED